jgi:hypothetical protein
VRETFLALLIIGGLLATGYVITLAWEQALSLSLILVAAGFALGVPTGVVYHILLRRALLEVDALPRDWYWRPISLHERVPPHRLPAILAWCYTGAFGFVVIVAGILVLVLSVLLAWQQTKV